MAADESLREIARARAPLSTWIGVVLLFFLFGVIVLAVIGPAPRGDTYEQKRAKSRAEKLKAVQEEAKTLTNYGWIDKNKGVARVPIDRAMELTVAELAQRKPAPAGPIATPQPQASAAPSATPTPTPTPSPSGTPKPTSVAGPSSEAANQPAAAINPPPAPPGTQPGASATPAASPSASAAKPVASPTGALATPPGSPLPVRGKETPTPTPP
jgi:hypothetical protein